MSWLVLGAGRAVVTQPPPISLFAAHASYGCMCISSGTPTQLINPFLLLPISCPGPCLASSLPHTGVLRVHERLARERSKMKDDDRAMRLEALKVSDCFYRACLFVGVHFPCWSRHCVAIGVVALRVSDC